MSAGVAEMDVTSELADTREVRLQELSDAVVARAVARVIPGTDVVAPGPRFSSSI